MVKLMTDEELQKYLIAPGDRLSVKNFCDKTNVETKQKVSLVEQLREKIEVHKVKRMQVGNSKAGHQLRKGH